MKLRIRENSLRFRLSQSEVLRLRDVGHVEETVQFVDALLRYQLLTGASGETLTAQFQDGTVRVTVPSRIAASWADSNQVGIESAQELADGATLQLIIEKDFKCLNVRPNEDESDAFPNPLAQHNC